MVRQWLSLAELRKRFLHLCRVCGKWTLAIAFGGAWNAITCTWQGFRWWDFEVHVQQRYGAVWPDVADGPRREKRNNFTGAVVGAGVSAFCIGIARKRWIRAKRSAGDQCLHCGYLLTGNTSGVCPECGRPIDKASQANPVGPGVEAQLRKG